MRTRIRVSCSSLTAARSSGSARGALRTVCHAPAGQIVESADHQRWAVGRQPHAVEQHVQRVRAVAVATDAPAPEAPQDRAVAAHPAQVQGISAGHGEALGLPAAHAGPKLIERVPAEDRRNRRDVIPAAPDGRTWWRPRRARAARSAARSSSFGPASLSRTPAIPSRGFAGEGALDRLESSPGREPQVGVHLGDDVPRGHDLRDRPLERLQLVGLGQPVAGSRSAGAGATP